MKRGEHNCKRVKIQNERRRFENFSDFEYERKTN